MPQPIRDFYYAHLLRPLMRVLRGGITPRRLAWSLALGMVIGINPSVGLSTLLVVLLAWCFGLNQLASQIGVHLVAPLHLLLFVPFLELGVHVFRTRKLPMTRAQLQHLSHHPVRFLRELWQWEWHALVVWGLAAALLLPTLAILLRRGIIVLMRRNRALRQARLEGAP